MSSSLKENLSKFLELSKQRDDLRIRLNIISKVRVKDLMK